MPTLNQVDKKVRMDRWNIIRFQLLIHCYLSDIHISQHDLSCLTLLGLTGEQTLENFCSLTRSRQIFSSNQSARNALAKAEKKSLIIKNGRNKKKIFLNPDLNIQTDGNIMLNYKVVRLVPILEPQES